MSRRALVTLARLNNIYGMMTDGFRIVRYHEASSCLSGPADSVAVLPCRQMARPENREKKSLRLNRLNRSTARVIKHHPVYRGKILETEREAVEARL